MKAIELTKEHLSKLLEMCEFFFPEYQIGKAVNHSTDSVLILYISKGNDITWMSWYEFIMTKLAPHFANKYPVFVPNNPGYDASCLLSDLMDMQEWYNNYHHIDYLYEQFKKIENEKV